MLIRVNVERVSAIPLILKVSMKTENIKDTQNLIRLMLKMLEVFQRAEIVPIFDQYVDPIEDKKYNLEISFFLRFYQEEDAFKFISDLENWQDL